MVANKSRFFLAIASFLLVLLAGTNCAAAELAEIYSVKVDGVSYNGSNDISVIAGETILIEVYFKSLQNASDVRIKAELTGIKSDVSDTLSPFDVEEGLRYKKILKLKIPYELKDEVSDNIKLSLKIWNRDFKTKLEDITLRVQRDSYKVNVLSIDMPNEVYSGQTLPVTVVVKNIGYNNLDDLYATIRIPSLGIERTSYLGDLVAVADCSDDDDCNDEDTLSKRFDIKIPSNSKEGIYSVEVLVKNDDVSFVSSKEVVIKNYLSGREVMSGTSVKTVNIGQDAQFSLVLANPSENLKVYRIIVDSPSEFPAYADTEIVAVPAGSSKTVLITGRSEKAGDYNIKVNVFSGDRLEDTTQFTAKVTESSKSATNTSIIALTVVLAVIFLVLLVILIVLLGKKPEKTEEYGESYY